MKTHGPRWVLAGLCLIFSGLLLLGGWLVPAHLSAVDGSVLQLAGKHTPSLVDCGKDFVRAHNRQAARMLLQAAQSEKIPGTETLASTLAAASETERLFPGGPIADPATPITTLVLQLGNRESVLTHLQNDGSPAVQELLRARDLTNTVLFPAASSASGQAFDAAVSVCGLLIEDNRVAPGLRDALIERAASATTHADAEPLEQVLLDIMSLGQRLNYGQLAAFISGINDPATLDLLSGQARNAGAQLPELYSAVVFSQHPSQVAAYLNEFSQTGLNDLSGSLRLGEGGVDELLLRRQRVYSAASRLRTAVAGPAYFFIRETTEYALRAPQFALMVKWFFYIASGFLLALAGHFARPKMAEIEEPLRVRGFHLIREGLFALGFVLVVLMLSEPFLAQESQKAGVTFRIRLPVAGAATAGTTSPVKTKIMNTGSLDTRSLLTLSLFFVLQGLIYCACLAKLAEIKRQKVPARVQLRLLENEEHLFDAGLYLGFAGTIVCLILVSLTIIQQSLMAAYSSTSFGIIFVSIFKIFNLRPVRRRLLLQAESQTVARFQQQFPWRLWPPPHEPKHPDRHLRFPAGQPAGFFDR